MEKSETLSQILFPKTSKENEQMSKVPYLSAVRSLMYDMMCTRSDICHAVGIKVGNIGFDGYISIWILQIYHIYRRYIDGYFYMNIDISEINKNTLKFM